MSADPIRKYLGVPEQSEPRALLGLGRRKPDAASVELALRNRIAKTYAHAEGRTDEAEQVRKRLRQAARLVLESLRPQQPEEPRWPSVKAPVGHPMARLTDFDRHVLAVLVGCGGWNAAARYRLVAVAAAYGVSVGGLFKVVQALSDYGRSGGAPLGLEQITAGEARADFTRFVPPTRKEPDPHWLAKVAPELMESTLRSTFRLSLLFGAITVLLGVIAIRVLLAPEPRPAPVAVPPRPIPTAVDQATARRPAKPPARELATFAEPPTFSGHALSAETVTAADECPRLKVELDTLARRITIADEPSEAVFRSWADCIRTIATGWVLVGDSDKEALDQAIFDALYAASDSPSVSDRLLEALTPPPWSILEPVDVWRGAWMAGTLARISQSSSLSPAVADRARLHLDVALGGPSVERATSFTEGAGLWLDRAASLLVDATDLDPGIYDLWEFWIAAQRHLGRGDRFEQAVLNVVEILLTSPLDLARPGPGVNVLGRLLGLVDFESSRVVKDRIGELLGDQDRFSSRDVWVLTSLLARSDAAPWFSEDLVLPADADWMFRRRIADRISQRWPEAATAEVVPEARVHGVAVDPELAARWLAYFGWQQKQEIAGTSEQLLDQLVATCRLNAAACWLAAGNAGEAAHILTSLESGGIVGGPTGAPTRSVRRAGEPIGADGGWAMRYEQAGRSAEERRKWMEALRANAGTDLGPIDAEVFVRVVYRGAPPEIRELAQTTLLEQFGDGPNVALELLDQLPGVPAGGALSDTIGQLTGRLLPSPHSDSWRVDARLALVEHVLDLLGPGSVAIDDKLGAVIRSYADRRAALDPDASSATPARTALEAAEGLGEAWRQRAMEALGEAAAGRATTGGLMDLQRRRATRLRLVSGPVQRFVAEQLAVLDLMAFAAVMDQPARAGEVAQILAESGRRRSRCARALEQTVEAERAMGRMWRLQIAVEGEGDGGGFFGVGGGS
ncbi:MAG: hypothetical protein ACYTE6_01775 [Planctomycetota bacterium]|jgi:hypothetical protein